MVDQASETKPADSPDRSTAAPAAGPPRAARARRAQLLRVFPFLAWYPVSALILRGDVLAGLTGALVLIPKAMAYAQLSGLPVHYGMYVAFVPAILAALWGSSRQLSTGPVAVISLMTAAALTPLATPYSTDYIALALLLTLMVGLLQFTLGVLKLGTIVNFVSHPVILGFMNAAAVIIALSQLDLLLGIPKERGDVFLTDIWVMLDHLPQTHLPTLAMALFAMALMLGLKRVRRLDKLSVLIAVAATIGVSALIGYERNADAKPEHIADASARELVLSYGATEARIQALTANAPQRSAQWRKLAEVNARAAAQLAHDIQIEQIDAAVLAAENKERMRFIGQLAFNRGEVGPDGSAMLHVEGHATDDAKVDGRRWRIRKIEGGELRLVGGGEVVGKVVGGLPSFQVPRITLDALSSLLAAAVVISLVGFMESIAMAKALAAKTKDGLDPNQELIGQGVANIGGAFFQSYPACGSFTGSAINLQAGAKTGFAMVFNGLFVAVTLLFFTPLLHHLPKATLAAIIVLAVASLFTPRALRQCWLASRADGIVALATFVVTLLVAPHLDRGILFGAGLAIALYLYRTVTPRVAQLGRHADGTLRDLLVYPTLPTSRNVVALRFDDSLYFANAAFFEHAVLEAINGKPGLKYLLVVGSGINSIDASGEEVVRHLVERLRGSGITLVFAGLKRQVLDVMNRTQLYELIKAENFFPHEDHALIAIYQWLGDEGGGELLPRPSAAAVGDAQ